MSSNQLLHFVSFTQSKENGYKQTDKQIKEREINGITLPEDCISFYFYDKILKIKDNGTENNLDNEKINISNTYYIGKIYNRDDVINELGENATILSDMEEMLADKVVKVKGDEFYILGSEDLVISPNKVNFKSKTPDYERVF